MNDGVDVDKLNVKGLVEYHNTINPKNPVKSFKTIAEGRKIVKSIQEASDPVELDNYRKGNKVNTTTAQKPTDKGQKPDAEKKPASPPRELTDMSKDGITIDSAKNRKEIAMFHGLNKDGIGAAWDAKAKLWAAKSKKPVEEAPGHEQRKALKGYAEGKTWPNKAAVKKAIDGLKMAMERL